MTTLLILFIIVLMFAHDRPLDVSTHIHIKNIDGNIVVAAEGGGSRIHNLKLLLQDFLMSKRVKSPGIAMDFGVLVVDAIDPVFGHIDDAGSEFGCAKSRRRVG